MFRPAYVQSSGAARASRAAHQSGHCAWCVDAIGGSVFNDGAHGWFGLYECNYGPNQEIQFVGEQPTYLDLGAFPVDEYGSRLVFQPKSCVGKSIPDDCTPPDRDEIVGTSEGPWPEFKLV